MSETGLRLLQGAERLEILVGDVAIATYVFVPDAPAAEAPKPYLSPLRSLSGAPMSIYRPWDHRWHKGLQMTLSHVSGQNFWGGPTFSVAEGYAWKENLGRIEHRGFGQTTAAEGRIEVDEELEWISSGDESWLRERRSHRFHSVDRERGIWAYDFSTELSNVAGKELELGSPTTHGREAAGYTGLFWRGPRAWTGGTITAAGLADGADAMGSSTAWLAISAQNDEIDGGATILAIAGSSSADVPLKWFVRNEPFAAIAPSPAFDQEIVLQPGAALSLRHRFVFIDRVSDADELAALGQEFAL
jgi:hypothetical protein